MADRPFSCMYSDHYEINTHMPFGKHKINGRHVPKSAFTGWEKVIVQLQTYWNGFGLMGHALGKGHRTATID